MSVVLAEKRVSSVILVLMLREALARHDGYIMGATGENPRTGYHDLTVPESKCKSSWKKSGHRYTQYEGRQLTKALYWREHAERVWDCNGLAEGIYRLQTGIDIDSKARYNYRDWCGVKGSGEIPLRYRVPGCAVFWGSSPGSIHHVGYLVEPVRKGHPEGDWYIIEARGVMYGVVRTKLSSRKPNYWGLMTKYYDYGDVDGRAQDDEPVQEVCPYPEPQRTVVYGAKGTNARWVQWHLLRWKADCLPRFGVDGDYGTETRRAVLDFKEDLHARGVTGITPGNTNVGPRTREELKKYV